MKMQHKTMGKSIRQFWISVLTNDIKHLENRIKIVTEKSSADMEYLIDKLENVKDVLEMFLDGKGDNWKDGNMDRPAESQWENDDEDGDRRSELLSDK